MIHNNYFIEGDMPGQKNHAISGLRDRLANQIKTTLVKSVDELAAKIADGDVDIHVDLSECVSEIDYKKLFNLLSHEKVKRVTLRSFYKTLSGEKAVPSEDLYSLLNKNDHLLELTVNHHDRAARKPSTCLNALSARRIAEALTNNHTLQVLDISTNYIENEGAVSLINAFAQSNTLLGLDISSNTFNINNGNKTVLPDNKNVFKSISGLLERPVYVKSTNDLPPVKILELQNSVSGGRITDERIKEIASLLQKRNNEKNIAKSHQNQDKTSLHEVTPQLIVHKNEVKKADNIDQEYIDLVVLSKDKIVLNQDMSSKKHNLLKSSKQNKALALPKQKINTKLKENVEKKPEENDSDKLTQLIEVLDNSIIHSHLASQDDLSNFLVLIATKSMNEIYKNQLIQSEQLNAQINEVSEKINLIDHDLKLLTSRCLELSVIANDYINLRMMACLLLQADKSEEEYSVRLERFEKEIQRFRVKISQTYKTYHLRDAQLKKERQEQDDRLKKERQEQNKIDVENIDFARSNILSAFRDRLLKLGVVAGFYESQFKDNPEFKRTKDTIANIEGSIKLLEESNQDKKTFDEGIASIEKKLKELEENWLVLKDQIQEFDRLVSSKLQSNKNAEELDALKHEYFIGLRKRIDALQDMIRQQEEQGRMIQETYKSDFKKICKQVNELSNIQNLDEFKQKTKLEEQENIFIKLNEKLRILERCIVPKKTEVIQGTSAFISREEQATQEKPKSINNGSKEKIKIKAELSFDEQMANCRKEFPLPKHKASDHSTSKVLSKPVRDVTRIQPPEAKMGRIRPPHNRRYSEDEVNLRAPIERTKINKKRWVLFGILMIGVILALTGGGGLVMGAIGLGGALLATGLMLTGGGMGGLIYTQCCFKSTHSRLRTFFADESLDPENIQDMQDQVENNAKISQQASPVFQDEELPLLSSKRSSLGKTS